MSLGVIILTANSDLPKLACQPNRLANISLGCCPTLLEEDWIPMPKMQITAVVRQEDGWFVAQALEVDVASQGESLHAALDNLGEALELHFEPPRPTVLPEVHHLRVKVGPG